MYIQSSKRSSPIGLKPGKYDEISSQKPIIEWDWKWEIQIKLNACRDFQIEGRIGPSIPQRIAQIENKSRADSYIIGLFSSRTCNRILLTFLVSKQ